MTVIRYQRSVIYSYLPLSSFYSFIIVYHPFILNFYREKKNFCFVFFVVSRCCCNCCCEWALHNGTRGGSIPLSFWFFGSFILSFFRSFVLPFFFSSFLSIS